MKGNELQSQKGGHAFLPLSLYKQIWGDKAKIHVVRHHDRSPCGQKEAVLYAANFTDSNIRTAGCLSMNLMLAMSVHVIGFASFIDVT